MKNGKKPRFGIFESTRTMFLLPSKTVSGGSATSATKPHPSSDTDKPLRVYGDSRDFYLAAPINCIGDPRDIYLA